MAATFEGKPCRKCGCAERYESTRKCVACVRALLKAYREANAERLKAHDKAYRKANAEKIKAKNKAYQEANAEKEKARDKAYREANAERLKAYRKAHRKRKAVESLTEELRQLREKQYDINSALLSIYKQRKKERNDDEQQATQPHDS